MRPRRVHSGRTVHPRMRGERGQCIGLGGADRGSSPHARGTHKGMSAGIAASRFIPACAGNASGPLCPAWTGTVHPRMRGERPSGPDGHAYDDGSSPHARGTLLGVFRPPA